MGPVESTRLPGIGVLRTFRTSANDWIGVLELASGTHQLFVDDRSDPDTRRLAAELDAEDSRQLAELLGAHDDVAVEEDVPGLLDWIQLTPGGPGDRVTINDLGLRTQTGATIVAVLRDRAHTKVDPEFELRGGDILVLTGGPDELAATTALLRQS